MLYDPKWKSILAQLADLMRESWVGRCPSNTKQNCLVTGLWDVNARMGKTNFDLDAYNALEKEALARGYDHPALFNDAPDRTLSEILEFIDAAERRANGDKNQNNEAEETQVFA